MKIFSLTIIASVLSSAFARSSVYLISEQQRQINTAAEVSLDTFNLVYSHLLETSQQQPSLKLQDNAQFHNLYSLWSNPTRDLFERKLNSHLMIVINGVASPQDIFNKEASFYVSEEDGDKFTEINQRSIDHIKENKDQGIVSTFDAKSELLTTEGGSVVLPMDSDFETRYGIHALDASKEIDRDFMDQVDIAEQMVLLLKGSQGSKSKIDLEWIDLNGLQLIIDEYGVQSEQYKEATHALKQFFENTLIPTFLQAYPADTPALSTIILTPPQNKAHMSKRDVPVLQDAATCFTSKDDCNNGTSHCSGSGTCKKVADKCYTCQCEAQHVGDACQYIDAVSDFQLLFWTGVFLIVTTAGVLTFVYKSGDIENGGVIMSAQPLPKQD
ncbi:hypothetical protein K501DRAFT_286063 [Backusella circina FSU 941]|nr:hypothetical protein K501DRAFT_286063 [Backusella circina FSU 941]